MSNNEKDNEHDTLENVSITDLTKLLKDSLGEIPPDDNFVPSKYFLDTIPKHDDWKPIVIPLVDGMPPWLRENSNVTED